MLHFALTAVLAPAVAAPLPCAFDLVGTWNLVSVSSRSADGRTNAEPMGRSPSGVLIYTADGHMSVMINYGGRKLLTSDDRLGGSVEERANAYDTSLGYSGRYTCSGNHVVHHVTVAIFQNLVNTDLVRVIKSIGGRLSLSTPAMKVGGSANSYELIWERSK